ncbi:MAG: riboflavin biosynthesis protein RibD, partial [Oceanicaulis sp.]|nr:riboflavin biosynthesis protein RibD [Oceanicaulis sp.]
MSARPVSVEDLRYMDAALALAYARLGATAPNPSVGCVIVRQGRIIG